MSMCMLTTQNMAKRSHSVTIHMKHKKPPETLCWSFPQLPHGVFAMVTYCLQVSPGSLALQVKEIWIQEQKLAFTIHFHVAYVTILYTKKCNWEEGWYLQYAKI